MSEKTDLSKLSADEQDLIQSLASFTPQRVEGDKSILSTEEWLASYYHSGYLGTSLFPFWKEQMIDVFEGKRLKYDELIVTGALSTGKSFFSLACWLRLLYIFTNIPNLQKHLGLAPSSRVLFAYLSVSAKEAELTGFGEFRTIIDDVPYFADHCPRNQNRKTVLEFPNGVTIIAGSDALHFIGAHLFSLIFDESNFVRRGGGNPGDVQKAFDIYHASRLRIKTRYAGGNRDLRGLNLLVSSCTHHSSFTEQTIAISRGTPTTKVISTRVFETKPKGTYSEEKFMFYLGTDLLEPMIISTKEQLKLTLEKSVADCLIGSEDVGELYEALPTNSKEMYVWVPEDFRDECEKFPDRALMDIIGHSAAVRSNFFKSIPDYRRCLENGDSLALKHPFSRDVFSIGTRDDVRIEDFLNLPYLKNVIQDNPCYMHIDQSTTNDSTGMGLAFPYARPGMLTAIVVPLLLRIVPPAGNDKISIAKCREFVEYLVANGIYIKKITYDQFQSASSIQILACKGFNAGNFSTDRSDEPWVECADLFYQGRLLTYDYKPFREEWFTLVHDRAKRKVDHPSGGSKDVADGFVGSVYNCLMDIESVPSQEEKNRALLGVLTAMAPVGPSIPDMEKMTGTLLGINMKLNPHLRKGF